VPVAAAFAPEAAEFAPAGGIGAVALPVPEHALTNAAASTAAMRRGRRIFISISRF
jgi:hypothetical protein